MKSQEGNGPESVLAQLDEQYQKYKFMEANLTQKQLRLKAQIPEIRTTLDAIDFLQSKDESSDPVKMQYLLSDQVYVNATVPPTKTVCLWLGANVMLEYEIAEAKALLTKNIETAKSNLSEVEKDINFLRDQITTTEVNMARVYNWDVKRRQKAKSS